MRYHANGTNPTRRTTARNGSTTSAAATKAMTNPMAISAGTLRREMVPRLEQIVRERRGHRRHGEKERELGRRRAIEAEQPCRRRSSRPSARHPGSAPAPGTRRCRAPARAACGRRRAPSAPGDSARRAASRCRPATNDTAMTRRAVVEDALDVVGEKQRPRPRPAGTRRESSARNAGRPDPTAGPSRCGRSWSDTATSRRGSSRAGS